MEDKKATPAGQAETAEYDLRSRIANVIIEQISKLTRDEKKNLLDICRKVQNGEISIEEARATKTKCLSLIDLEKLIATKPLSRTRR